MLVGTNDLRLVWEKAGALSGHWDSIGIMLGLSSNKLDEIEAESKTARACLRKVFDSWLKRDYDYESHGVPTLRMLCNCIKSESGGANPALAERISGGTPTPSGPSSTVSLMGCNSSVSIPTSSGGASSVSAGDAPGLSSTVDASKSINI